MAAPKIYNQCDEDIVDFIIRLKANARLNHFAEQALPNIENEDYTHSRTVYFDFDYQAGTWDRPQRVCAQAIRPADELFYRYSFITTSLIKVPVQSVIEAYQRQCFITYRRAMCITKNFSQSTNVFNTLDYKAELISRNP